MKHIKLMLLTMATTAVCRIAAQAPNEKYSWSHLPQAEQPVFKTDTFNIVTYGAVADGVTLNTAGINKAIQDCHAKGGGIVLVPPGVWLTGPLVLLSNVNLHVSRSALLQFTADKKQYPLMTGSYEGHVAVRNQSPISADDAENIAITGEGVVDGHGEVWRAMGKERVTENEWKQMNASGVVSNDGKTWYPSESYALGAQTKNAGYIEPGKTAGDYAAMKDFFRPNMLVFTNCKKVLLQQTTFQNSPNWCLHLLMCEQLTLNGVRVRNEENAQNGDGIDLESCSNVLVENCTLDCGDDGLCIKSGRDEEGRKRGKASQYMVLRNNVVYKAHGGFVIGSEMSGGAHDIFVDRCTFIGTDNGLRFKTVRGRGGVVENIYVKNISMHAIVHDAILFDMYYFTKAPSLAQTNGDVTIPPVNEGTPQFRNFYIDSLVCDGAERAMLVRGLPEMSIKNIYLSNISIKAKAGADIAEAQHVNLKNVALYCDRSLPPVNVENSAHVSFDHIAYPETSSAVFSINGSRTGNIIVAHTRVPAAGNIADFKYGAEKSSLTVTE